MRRREFRSLVRRRLAENRAAGIEPCSIYAYAKATGIPAFQFYRVLGGKHTSRRIHKLLEALLDGESQ